MIHGRRPPPRGTRATKQTKPFRDRIFFARLLLSLGIGFVGCLLVFLLPTLYFVEQNYATFITLAYDVKPSLVHHLEREVLWLRFFIGAGAGAALVVCFLFGRRLLRDLLAPLEALEDHMREHTEIHSTPAPHDGRADRTLFLTYASFRRTLREQTEEDLRALERLTVDPAHREAYTTWKNMVKTYRIRLGLPEDVVLISETSEESSATGSSRRAS